MSFTFSKSIDFLQGPNQYRILRNAVRKYFFEGRATLDQLDLVQQIIALSPTDPNFEDNLKNLRLQKDKIDHLMQQVMNMPPRQESPSMDRKEAVVLSPTTSTVTAAATRSLRISKPNLHCKESLGQALESPPTPKRKELELVKPKEFTTDIDTFEIILDQARQLKQNPENLSPFESNFVAQILAAKVLLDGMSNFDEAIRSCLGSKALERRIKDEVFDSCSKGDPKLTRTDFLIQFVEILLKRANAQPQVQRTFSRRNESSFSRPNPGFALSLTNTRSYSLEFPKKKKPLQKRSNSIKSLSQKLQTYPEALQTPGDMEFSMVSAVIIRLLCREKCADLFKNKELLILDNLMNLFLFVTHSDYPYEVCVERFFKELNTSNSPLLARVFQKLNKQQTISRIQAGIPSIPHDYALPAVFNETPFNQKDTVNRLIHMLVKIKFEWATSIYTEYSKGEQQAIDLLLRATLIMHAMHFEFSTCLKILLSQIDEGVENPIHLPDVTTLYHKAMPELDFGPSSTAAEVSLGEEDLNLSLEHLLEFPWIRHPLLFDIFMENVSKVGPITRNPCTRELCKLFDAISKRSAEISLDQAKKNSLTLNALRVLFQSENDGNNLSKLSQFLLETAPKTYVSHSSFQSREALLELIAKGAEYPFSASLEHGLLEVLEKLESMGILLKADPTMTHEEAILLSFHDLELRRIFNSNEDFKNVRRVEQYVDQILKI